MASAAPQTPRAVFTEGSTLRHVLVMTATGSIGLMAFFVVDLLSILYISWLGNPALTAGVGFATQIIFLVISINIGMSIGVGALVARAIGAGEAIAARRLAASGLVQSVVLSSVVGFAIWPFRVDILRALGADGVALDAAAQFLAWTLPATGMMAAGMILSGILRAAGDARRAMYVTLSGAMFTAIVDPILILGMKMGVLGAAITSDLSRLVWLIVGGWGVVHAHNLIGRPSWKKSLGDMPRIFAISGPATLTNLAAPVASLYSVAVLARFGESAVAAGSIIDRIVPVAFGAVFAMSGVVGPIVGQNFGAGLIGRVRGTLTSSFAFSACYVLAAWGMLYLATPFLIWVFSANGETAELVAFFCAWGALGWVFLGCLFAANAAFNNLGHATLSLAFNWGRATLGFIPFITLGAHYFGAKGVIMGAVAGAAVFGLGAIVCAYWVVDRLEKAQPNKNIGA